MDTFEEIKKFVVEQRWNYNFPLTRETSLRNDLKLWGDDAGEFIENFGKRFNVGLSELDLRKYFPPEGDFILPTLIRILLFKKQPVYLPLTLGDLEEAAKKGKLIS